MILHPENPRIDLFGMIEWVSGLVGFPHCAGQKTH